MFHIIRKLDNKNANTEVHKLDIKKGPTITVGNINLDPDSQDKLV